ncbi:MAG: exosortase-associated EpsI family protein [Phycisphaerae bacterium]|nr:exosortase-associated EpsI family protein [Phycisphaerae bacterium]
MTPNPSELRPATGRPLLEPAFIAALLVILAAGAGLRYAKATGSLQILKRPAPLLKQLSDLSPDVLAPYILRDSARLPEETEQELGTKAYIQWTLENPQAPEESWERRLNVFATYYTGNPDQVPHVPEECYQQGAFGILTDDYMEFKLGAIRGDVPIRRLAFRPPSTRAAGVCVYYTFAVNGDFYAHRNAVRLRMADPRERYLYYCKIELAFFRQKGAGTTPEMDRAAERIMGQLLPELIRNHLPDTAALEKAAANAS